MALEGIMNDFQVDFGDNGASVFAIVALCVCYSFAAIFGAIGNGTVLYAILSKTSLRSARNFFILILTVSDLLLCLLTIPLKLWDALR